MKRLMLLFFTLLLVGCNEQKPEKTSYPNTFRAQIDDFVYELAVQNDAIVSGEPIQLIASLTYVGEQPEVTISHAASPFYFSLTETTTNYTIDSAMDMPLLYTTLKRNEPMTTSYAQSGGYSEDDEAQYKAFVQAFLAGSPHKGYYVVTGSARFNLQEQSHKLEGHVGFSVQ